MIVYEDKTVDNSILDEWMGKAITSQANSKASVPETMSSIFEENKNKMGLGFTNKKDKSKAQLAPNEPIAKILLKQQKKNQKRSIDQVDQQSTRDLHGIIETDIFEDSRTQLIKPHASASARNSAKPVDASIQAKKKQKKDQSRSQHESTSSKGSMNGNASPSSARQKSQHLKTQQSQKSDEALVTARQASAINDDFTSYSESKDSKSNKEDGTFLQKRKRKKTRSKQKNIRKDTRSHDQKPEYLREDSERFTGRELTEETKRHLKLQQETV